MQYETIITETRGRVALVTLNRPEALNAINKTLTAELLAALEGFAADDGIGCIVITGSDRAFAAGADIKEMEGETYIGNFLADKFAPWERMTAIRKPMIAAVSGYALGGGCELAMMCDFILAADNAKFGQPEIKLGLIPGMGGTQRLSRLVGTAKAMEMCLTGRLMGADEAEKVGLVSRVVPAADLIADALKTAETIASMSLPAAILAKESIHRINETTLAEGLRFERRVFHSLFALEDQKEGRAAFIEKRKPDFKHR
jgi:enoyl-CoA hydratase